MYGPGSAGFGILSAAVLAGLALLVAVAVLLARQPRELPLDSLRRSALGRWAQAHLGTRARALADRLSVDVVAAAGLLAGLGVVAALGLAFATVLDDVLEGDGVNGLDEPAARWVADHRDLWLSDALKIVTHLGDSPVIATLGLTVSLLVAWRSRRWLPAVLGIAGIAGIGLMIVIAKTAIGRSRPPAPVALITENGYSFPSGHATGMAAIAGLCGWILTRWLVHGWAARVTVWAVVVGAVGAVGFSRIYLGVHYLSDVLAGWLLGAAWAATVIVVGAWWDSARRSQPLGRPPSGRRMQRQHQRGQRQHRDQIHRPAHPGPGDEHAAESQ